jgi:tryptophan-rich sensory protein
MPFTNVDWLGLIAFSAVGYAPAIVSAIGARAPAVYSRMKKAVAVPVWVFSIVWILVYALLSIGAFLFWQTEKEDPSDVYHAGLAMFVLHQILNALWVPLFMAQGWLAAALADLILCFLVAIVMCGLFFVNSAAAGALIIPILLWYLFLGFLTADAIYRNGAKFETPGIEKLSD